MKGLILYLVCSLVFFPVATPAQAPKDAAGRAEALRLVDAWLASVQAYRKIPAISAGVVVGDDLVWAKGFGTIDANHTVPATPQTIYSICSISKLFTSVSFMTLYEAGKVHLDDPLTTYLPWAKFIPAPDSGPITMRGLLTHSSGINREAADAPYWSGPDFAFPTTEQIHAAVPTEPALYPAERYFQYSNLGLTLVGETVEAVSGQPYADYATSHVLKPLGLSDTRPIMPMDLYGKQVAAGFSSIKRDGTRDLLKPFNARGLQPAAGYTSTVVDLGKFASWQFRLLRTGHAEILEAPTLREMQRVQFMDPDWKTSRGLGFQVEHRDDHIYVGHGGNCPGYQTNLSMRNDDQTAVVVMDNSGDAVAAFAQAIFAILDKRKSFSFKAPMPAEGIKLEDYAGLYSAQPFGSESVVLPWAGGLVQLSLPSTDPAAQMSFLKPKGGDIFKRVRPDGTEAEDVKFVRDDSGKVIRIVHFSNLFNLESSLAEAK
jgi:CubicO group peptidase (beta-lactamase class C family)